MTRLIASDPASGGFASALAEAGLPACSGKARGFALADGEGFGAIDGDGADRLLRSVVVPLASRGRGVGARLVAALTDEARHSGAERLWLLTTDAGEFFAGLGWTIAHRDAAPEAIRASDQFTTLCPASATLMVRELRS